MYWFPVAPYPILLLYMESLHLAIQRQSAVECVPFDVNEIICRNYLQVTKHAITAKI